MFVKNLVLFVSSAVSLVWVLYNSHFDNPISIQTVLSGPFLAKPVLVFLPVFSSWNGLLISLSYLPNQVKYKFITLGFKALFIVIPTHTIALIPLLFHISVLVHMCLIFPSLLSCFVLWSEYLCHSHPPHLYIRIPTAILIVVGGEIFGRWLDHESKNPHDCDLCPCRRDPLCLSPHVRKGSSPDNECVGTLILDFLACRTMRMLLFICHPICGILL
jgi:hypothetical protein